MKAKKTVMPKGIIDESQKSDILAKMVNIKGGLVAPDGGESTCSNVPYYPYAMSTYKRG